MNIRIATAADKPGLRILIKQLGYDLSDDELDRKINLFSSYENCLLVAGESETLSGFIALHIFESFHLPGRTGRITSFCVDEKVRGVGIGKQLLLAAEKYFRDMGCIRSEVTSNSRRTNAHDFYVRNGYQNTSAKFVKVLIDSP